MSEDNIDVDVVERIDHETEFDQEISDKEGSDYGQEILSIQIKRVTKIFIMRKISGKT